MLDKLLVDAAVEAGVEVREAFSVDEIVFEDGRVVGIKGRSKTGEAITERTNLVIGADGRHSKVAEAVNPAHYHDKPMLLAPSCAPIGAICRSMDGSTPTFVHTAGLRRHRHMTA